MDAALNYELIKMSCKIYRLSFCPVVVLDQTMCCHLVHLAEIAPTAPGILLIHVAHLFTPKAWFKNNDTKKANVLNTGEMY